MAQDQPANRSAQHDPTDTSPRPLPSQAEGERETADEQQHVQRSTSSSGQAQGDITADDQTTNPQVPSQAEGDRETVEHTLND